MLAGVKAYSVAEWLGLWYVLYMYASKFQIIRCDTSSSF